LNLNERLKTHAGLDFEGRTANPSNEQLNRKKQMVGATGFEPATASSQSWCSTKLSYAPTTDPIITGNPAGATTFWAPFAAARRRSHCQQNRLRAIHPLAILRCLLDRGVEQPGSSQGS
jgi:hypothetical protein